MERLTLNGKEISYDHILKGKYSASSSFENSTLNFSREWLSGKSNFSIFTSGSTGKPKEIILHRDQMISSARMTGFTLSIKAGDKSLICLNTEFIAGIMMLVRGFELKMNMTIIEPSSNPLKNIPVSESFDFTALVPMQMQKILEESQDKIALLNNMKAILLGGSPVSNRLEEDLQQITVPVFSTYGMTETVSHIAFRRLNGDSRSELYTIIEGVKTGTDERGCLTINTSSASHHTIVTNDLVEQRFFRCDVGLILDQVRSRPAQLDGIANLRGATILHRQALIPSFRVSTRVRVASGSERFRSTLRSSRPTGL